MKYFLAIIVLTGALASAFFIVTNVVEARSRTIQIRVDKKGFSPSSINAEAGRQVKLVFNRADSKNCGNTVVFPSLNIRKSLPVGKNVVVTLTPTQSGEITFTCGMGMYKGSVVVGQ